MSGFEEEYVRCVLLEGGALNEGIIWPNEQSKVDAGFIESEMPELHRIKLKAEASGWEYNETPAWETRMRPIANAIVRVAEALDFTAKFSFKPNHRYDNLQYTWWQVVR